VHRDIKPGNLLLDERDRLAIADFGIARLAMEDQLTMTGQVLGTASYISPEQAVGDPATAASDRYALAIVAFELLTGTKPFQAEHFAAQARAHVEDAPPLATERDASLPTGVDRVLDRGMAKDPGERWPSAREMVDALDRAMGSKPAAAAAAPATEATQRLDSPPPPPPPAAAPPQRDEPGRRPGVALLAGLAGLLLIAVLGFVLLSGGGDGDGDAEQASQPTPTATAERTPKPTATETAEPTATATATPTETPEPTNTPEPSGEPDLARAADLQVQGFNARQAGSYEEALALSQQALEACGDAQELNPCGYALYEVGAALNALGRPDEAIPYLEQRLNTYGNNADVKSELKKARKAAKGGD
jgi:eukaryotic-like serine/threonine-protein kinase